MLGMCHLFSVCLCYTLNELHKLINTNPALFNSVAACITLCYSWQSDVSLTFQAVPSSDCPITSS